MSAEYNGLILSDKEITVKLTGEEQAAILEAYDNGMGQMSQDAYMTLSGLIAEIKQQLHP